MAKHRAGLGWTQARLAERVGLSRVAVSHVEAGLTVPSERTVILLAGIFGREPHELTGGTDYPLAKAERLPLVAARHTEVDHQLLVLDAVLELLDRLPAGAGGPADRLRHDVRDEWQARLRHLADRTPDPADRTRVRTVLRGLVAGASGDGGDTA